jgi:uncharacterized membrane protein
MASSEIEPATLRIVAQCLNQLRDRGARSVRRLFNDTVNTVDRKADDDYTRYSYLNLSRFLNHEEEN